MADQKQYYVMGCERTTDRLAVTFQISPGVKFTWWQRKEDFDPDDFDSDKWEEAAAVDYEGCAHRLAGDASSVGFPNIAMGDLRIAVVPKTKDAQIDVRYSDYGARSATVGAEYTFVMPAEQLAAAFSEAAATIRALIA